MATTGVTQYRGNVTHPPRRAFLPADASVLLSVRGMPSWGAILVALICAGLGMYAGRSGGDYTVNWAFGAIFTAGIALAALAVRRGSIFTGMVQAPIILTVVVLGTFRFLGSNGAVMTASKLVASFPIMAVATGIGLLLGLVRIIAQPAHHRRDDSGYYGTDAGRSSVDDEVDEMGYF